MGLDTTHGCWHGAYSAFSRFRNLLWEAAGGTLIQDQYYTHPAEIDFDALEDRNFQGEWGRYPEDPLIVLMAHSDCDGHLEVDILEPLAHRLEELAPKLPTEGAGHLYDPRGQTLQFAAGLREAASKGERVEFH